MIGSWTDLSMMGAPLRRHRRVGGPAAAGGQRRRGGRPGLAAVDADRQPAVAAGAGADQDARRGPRHRAAARPGHARSSASRSTSRPVVDVTDGSDDDGDRRPLVRLGSRRGHRVRGRLRAGAARRRPAAGAQALPRPRPRLGRLAHRAASSPRRWPICRTTTSIPYRTLTTQAPVAVMVGHLQVPGLTGSDPASLSPAAYGLLRSRRLRRPAVRRPGVHRRPVQHGGHQRSATASPTRCCAALQAGADVALWVTTAEVPAVLDRLEKAVAAGELAMPQVDDVGAADGRGQGPQSALLTLIRRSHCLR